MSDPITVTDPPVPASNRILNEDSGQDLIEYALIAAMVGLSAISGMKGLATDIATALNGVSDAVTNSIPQSTPSQNQTPIQGGGGHGDHGDHGH